MASLSDFLNKLKQGVGGVGQGINQTISRAPMPILQGLASAERNYAYPVLNAAAQVPLGIASLVSPKAGQFAKQQSQAIQANSTLNLPKRVPFVGGQNPIGLAASVAYNPLTYVAPELKGLPLLGKVATTAGIGALGGITTPVTSSAERAGNIGLNSLFGQAGVIHGVIPKMGPTAPEASRLALNTVRDRIGRYAPNVGKLYKPSIAEDARAAVSLFSKPEMSQELDHLAALMDQAGRNPKNVGHTAALKDAATYYLGPNAKNLSTADLVRTVGNIVDQVHGIKGKPVIGTLEPLGNYGLGLVGRKGGEAIKQVEKPVNPNINVDRLNISAEAKADIKASVESIKDSIASKTGSRLSNQEAIALANTSSKQLTQAIGREDTVAWQAQLLNARQAIAKAAEEGKLTPEALEAIRAVKTAGTDVARKLQSFSISADPKGHSLQEQMVQGLVDLGHSSDDILKAAKGVDFKDANQATQFWRHFVAPTLGEYVDAIRYNSMLSSPNTHINNAFGNVLQSAVVAPIEKTLTGTLDFLGSSIARKPRSALAAEGPSYAKGYWSSIGDASHAFANTLKGKNLSTNLDINRIPLGDKTLRSKIIGSTEYVGKLLEASDQFFTKLTEGGEAAALRSRQKAGIKVKGDITEEAQKRAAYRLFRQDLHNPDQGPLLEAVDFLTGTIQKARSANNPVVSTVAKFTLPFVKTPMNILKQGIEYSPFGVSTIPGAANKTEQLSKTIIGTSAMAATSLLATSGRTTWAVPTDPKKKAAFYAAGLQPYSVKIGNQWVSYTKLPPALSFPIAIVAALHDANDQKHLSDNQLDTLLSGLAKSGAFFADQSYLKNIGDLISTAKGDPTAFSQFVGNYPQQVIPYRAMLGWVERLIDPNLHQVDKDANFFAKQFQQIASGIPVLADMVPLRQGPTGEPLPAPNRVTNAFSPLKTSPENAEGKDLYNQLQEQTQQTRYLNDVKKNPDLISALDIQAAEKSPTKPTPTPQPTLSLQQQEKLKQKRSVLNAQLKVAALAGKNDKASQLQAQIDQIDRQTKMASLQQNVTKLTASTQAGLSGSYNQQQRLNLAADLYKKTLSGDLTEDEAAPLIKKLGVAPNDLRDRVVSSLPIADRSAWVWDEIQTGIAKPSELIRSKLLTSAVVDQLFDQGQIQAEDVKLLKGAIKAITPSGKAATATKKAKKGKKLTIKTPKVSVPKAPKSSYRISSPPSLKRRKLY